MIDNCSDRLMKFLINKGILKESQYENIDFYFRMFLFNFIIISLLLFLNILFGSWKEMIIISIVFNVIRANSIDDGSNNGYHASTLEKCMVISVLCITLCSVIAHIFISYYMIFYSLSIIGGIYIYKKCIPSKIYTENKNTYLIILLSLISLITISGFFIPFLPLLKLIIIGVSVGILSVVWFTCDIGVQFLRFIESYL